jgi:hypothetical protein
MSNINSLILSSEFYDPSLNDAEKEIIELHQAEREIDQKINDEWIINLALEKRSLAFIQYFLDNKFKIKGGKSAIITAAKAYRGAANLVDLFQLVEHRE